MEPITRKEKFLAAAGGQSIDLPTPVTREEVFLKAIAEGGGGGGSGDDVFVCTFTKSGSTISCDKTGDEIISAHNAGKIVIGLANYSWVTGFSSEDAILYLTKIGDVLFNNVEFSVSVSRTGVDNVVQKCGVYKLTGIKATDTWTWSVAFSNAIELPLVTADDNGKILKVVNGEWTAVDMSPLIVTYTITGLPSNNVYPLSASHTLAEIASAYAAGKEVLAQIEFGGYTITKAYEVREASDGVVSVSVIGIISGTVALGVINHTFSDNTDTAYLLVSPLNTSQMSFNSQTNTLAITQ